MALKSIYTRKELPVWRRKKGARVNLFETTAEKGYRCVLQVSTCHTLKLLAMRHNSCLLNRMNQM